MPEVAVREPNAADLGEVLAAPRPPGLLGDTVAVLGAQAMTLAAGAGATVITARLLGPSGQGVFGLTTLWIGLFALALPMSAGYGFLYRLGQGKLSLSEALSNALVFSLLVGAVGVAVSSGASLLWGRRLVPGVPLGYLVIAASGLPAMIFGSTAGLCLTGAGWIRLGARIGALSSLASVALCALLVWGLRLGVLGAVLAAVGTSYVQSALIFALAGRRARIRPTLELSQIRSAVRFGLRIHFGFLAQLANYRLDRFLVNCFLGPAAVGLYGLAVMLSELLWYLPAALGNALYPRANSLQADSAEVTERACRLSVVVVAGACLVAAVAGPPLIPIIFGAKFAGAGRVLWTLLPGVLALTAGKVVAPYLVGHDRPAVGTYAAVSSLVATVVLDLALIPRWGLAGAGVASSCSYVLAATVMVGAYLRGRRAEGPAPTTHGTADERQELPPESAAPGPEHYTPEYYAPAVQRYLQGDGWSLARVRDIVRAAQFRPGEKVLDAGCGFGTVTVEGAKRGACITALDFSASSLATVRHLSHLLGLGGVQTIEASVTSLPFPDGSFGKVVSADLVEHLSPAQVHAFLHEAKRVLREDGRLVLYTPNGCSLSEKMAARRRRGEARRDAEEEGGEASSSVPFSTRLGRRLLYGLLRYTRSRGLQAQLCLPSVFPAMSAGRDDPVGQGYEHLHVNVMEARDLIARCLRTGFRLERAVATRTGTVLELLPYPLNLYWGGHVSLVFAKTQGARAARKELR